MYAGNSMVSSMRASCCIHHDFNIEIVFAAEYGCWRYAFMRVLLEDATETYVIAT